MANNANDPSRGTHRLNPETFANNILAAESMLREIFVDDYHWFTPLSIVLIEEAALKRGIPMTLKVIGGYAGSQRERLLIRRQADWAWSGRLRTFYSIAHRDDVCQSGEFNIAALAARDSSTSCHG